MSHLFEDACYLSCCSIKTIITSTLCGMCTLKKAPVTMSHVTVYGLIPVDLQHDKYFKVECTI